MKLYGASIRYSTGDKTGVVLKLGRILFGSRHEAMVYASGMIEEEETANGYQNPLRNLSIDIPEFDWESRTPSEGLNTIDSILSEAEREQTAREAGPVIFEDMGEDRAKHRLRQMVGIEFKGFLWNPGKFEAHMENGDFFVISIAPDGRNLQVWFPRVDGVQPLDVTPERVM